MKKVRTETLDAAGVLIRVGDTVGGVTSKLTTVVGELIQIGTSKVKVRLDQDAVPAGPGRPQRGDERWLTAERTFLVRRAPKTRQVLFTGAVDPDLTPAARQGSAWLLTRAVTACDCTDPDPATCTAGCWPAPRRPQCRCHHIQTVEEILNTLIGSRDLDPVVDDLDDLWRHLVEVYCETGHRDADAQRYAREFLAHHARSLAVTMRSAVPVINEDSGHVFGGGFTGGVHYLRAYAYGLDPEGNGAK